MFQMISAGFQFTHRDGLTIDRPHGAGFHVLVLYRSRAEMRLDGRMVRIEPNTFVLFGPDTPHFYRELEKPLINDWVHFSISPDERGLETAAFLQSLGIPLETPIRAQDPLTISRRIMDLQAGVRDGGPHGAEILDAELRCLLLRLSAMCGAPTLPPRAGQYLQAFTELRNELYSQPNLHVPVETLARRVQLGKSRFQHLYREMFGISVVQDMILSRIAHARYLLENSQASVSAIAELCGYENDVHFMRQFRKAMGISPGAYRSRQHAFPRAASPASPPARSATRSSNRAR